MDEFVFVAHPIENEGDQEQDKSVTALISLETGSSASSPLLPFHDAKSVESGESETKVDEGVLKSLLEIQIVTMETSLNSMDILAGKIPSDKKLPQALKKIRETIEQYKTKGNSGNSEPQSSDSLPTGPDESQVLPLDVLTDDESLEFILKELEIPEPKVPEFREELKEFIELIGGLPLALQQAVAFIKQEKKYMKFLGKTYEIKDYVQDFKSSRENFQSSSPASDSTGSSSSATFLVTTNEKMHSGESANKILEFLSFLHADKIPLLFLQDLVPEIEDGKFSGTLELLENYSMIKMDDKDFSLSIHGQLQHVILQSLKESNEINRVLMNVVKKCQVILKNITLLKSDDVVLSFHQIVKNQFAFIPMDEKSGFLDFMYNFGLVLCILSRYSESLDVYKIVHSGRRDLLGENHEKTLESQFKIAVNLHQLGKYDEALTLYKEILEKQEIHPDLGVDHPQTIETKYCIVLVLLVQNKYGETLEPFQQVLAHRKKVLGENHPNTLKTQHWIGVVLYNLGRFAEALELRQQLEKKQIEILGPDHADVLESKVQKAFVFLKIDRGTEALGLLLEVNEKRNGIRVDNRLTKIGALYNLSAENLEKESKLTQARENYEQVYKSRKTNSDLG